MGKPHLRKRAKTTMKKHAILILILILAMSSVIYLTACGSVEPESIIIDTNSQFKTDYSVGDDFDVTGIKIVVANTDGSVEIITLSDIKGKYKILGFDSKKIGDQTITIVYEECTTTFTINVAYEQSALIKHVVSFETGKGSKIEPVTVSNFTTVTAPEDPVRAGYAFDGWYKQDTLVDEWNFTLDRVVADTTLYAKWSKVYTITFHPTEGSDLTPIIRNVKEGGSLTDIPPVPEIEGKDGVWDRTVFDNVMSNIDTYSVYSPKTFTVSFYYMKEDGISRAELRIFEDVPYGTNMNTDPEYEQAVKDLNSLTPETLGSTHFSGEWDTRVDYVVADLDVYAVYVANQYDVTFNLNYDDGNGSTYYVERNVIHGDAIREPVAPTREGYRFDGWYTQSLCINAWDFATGTIESEKTLYAKWTQLHNVYYLIDPAYDINNVLAEKEDVTFDEGGVSVTYKLYEKVVVEHEGSSNILSVPNMVGYNAVWDKEQVALMNITTDVKVKAMFTIKTFDVNFYNGSELLKHEVVSYGSSATAPESNPTQYGYNFTGWNVDFSNVTDSINVLATFEAQDCNVVLVKNNGTANETIVVKFNSAVNVQEPTYQGYSFKGWYRDSNFLEAWDVKNDVITKTEDTYLYAKWAEIFTIQFVDGKATTDVTDDVTYSLSVVDGDKIPVDRVPALTTFEDKIGVWKSGTNVFDVNLPITSSVVYVAEYSIKVYDVVFKVEGETYWTIEKSHGSTIIQADIPEDPRVTGKTFARWTPNPVGTLITDNTEFSAIMETNEYEVIWYSDVNGNVEFARTIAKYGTRPSAPEEDPILEGHSFAGWYSKEDNSVSLADILVNGEIELVPKFTLNTYSVTFENEHDGSEIASELRVDYNLFVSLEDVIPTNPTREGYTFTSWKVSNFEIFYGITVDTWTLKNSDSKYDATEVIASDLIITENGFYVSGGYGADTEAKLYQGTYKSCNKLVNIGENGWSNGGVPVNAKDITFDGNVYYVISKNTDFKAHFEINVYTVTYDYNIDGVADEVKEGTHGATPYVPAEKERDGYVFLGWYLDEDFYTLWDSSQPLVSSYTVYAKWEKVVLNYTQGVTYVRNQQGTAYSVSGYTTDATEIIIANYFNELPVESIADGAFKGNKNLKRIVLPQTLTSIGTSAFQGCIALEEIEIPSLVTIISQNAFYGCSSLARVIFADNASLRTIEGYAFAECRALKYASGAKSFELSDGLVSIGEGAFMNDVLIDHVNVPSSVLSIGDKAFSGCDLMRYAKFNSASPLNLGKEAFAGNHTQHKVFRIYVPSVDKYTVDNAANDNWKGYSSIINDIDNISDDGEWAFVPVTSVNARIIQYLGNDTDVTVPTQLYVRGAIIDVVALDNYVFDVDVENVSFNSGLTIDNNTFSAATALTNITLSIDIRAYNVNGAYLANAWETCPNLDTFSVSPTRTLVSIFDNKVPSGLRTINLLADSNYVVAGMLEGCHNVKTVKMTTRVTEIRSNAFANCLGLTDFYIQTTTGYMSAEASKLQVLGSNAFRGSEKLVNFWYASDIDGENYVKALPNTITTIGENAFDNTSWLLNNDNEFIEIGDGILYKYTGNSANVVISKSVKEISPYAFSNNPNIVNVYVYGAESGEAQLKTIGKYAFENCIRLEYVALPASFTAIREYAFTGCRNLQVISSANSSAVSISTGTFDTNKNESLVVYVEESDFTTEASLNDYRNNGWGNYVLKAVTGIETEQYFTYCANNENPIGAVDVIKSFSTEVAIPEILGGKAVVAMGDYAVSRFATSISFSMGVATTSNTFKGIKGLEALTIKGVASLANVKLDKEGLYSLINENVNLSEIEIGSRVSVKNVLGGKVLPAHVKSVVIPKEETTIASDYLNDCVYVEEIYVYVSGTKTAISSCGANDVITSIGARVFRNTAWMNNKDTDYIAIFDGILIDYNGSESILRIGDGIKVINDNVFENDDSIEIVYVGESVEEIGEGAFNNASRLTKVIINKAGATLPTSYSSTFVNNAKGFEIYADYEGVGAWNAQSPQKIDASFVFITEEDIVKEEVVDGENYVTSNNVEIIMKGSELLSYVSYKKVAVDGLTKSVKYATSLEIPEKINATTIDSIGNNVFLSKTTEIRIAYNDSITNNTFTNLDGLEIIEIRNTHLERKILGKQITDVIKATHADTIRYAGDVTLDVLLEYKDSTDPLINNPRTYPNDAQYGELQGTYLVKNVEILEGSVTTVDSMLAGWVGIENVKFADSLMSIGINALEDTNWYKNYNNLTYGGKNFVVINDKILYKYRGTNSNVNIPTSIIVVNAGAFSNATAQADGEWIWEKASSVSAISFTGGSKATTIGEYAFAQLNTLTNVNLPSTMRNIAHTAFEGTSFSTENGMLLVSGSNTVGKTLVKYVGTSTTINIPANVININANAFRDNVYIETLTVEEGGLLSVIGEYAFNGCANLTSVSLGNSLTSIGQYALHGTKWHSDLGRVDSVDNSVHALVTISGKDNKDIIYDYDVQRSGMAYTISTKVLSITPGALDGITSLTLASGANIPQEEMYRIISHEALTSLTTDGKRALSDLIGSEDTFNNVKTLTFEYGATQIADHYAYGWGGVTNVAFANSIKSIGKEAFEGTAWLNNQSSNYVIAGGTGILIKYKGSNTEVEIPEDVKAITSDVFRGNTNVTKVIFVSNSAVTEIPTESFMGCTSLTEIILPANVASVGESAFDGTPWWDNKDSNYLVINGMLVDYKGTDGKVVISSEVEKIYSYVFRGNNEITSVTFDKNCQITEIEENVFANCISLTSVTLNENIIKIEPSAFAGTAWFNTNNYIYYIDSTRGIKRIVYYAGTSNNIRIPADVTEISPYAFQGNKTIASLQFDSGSLVTSIPDYAFSGCSSLTSVTLPSSIKHIGEGAFEGTLWLKNQSSEFVIINGKVIGYNGVGGEVTLPDSVNAIDADAFSGNVIITSIDMSATSIKEIPAGAFAGMTALESIIFSQAITAIGEGAFEGTAWFNNQVAEFVVINGVLVKYNGGANAIVPEEVTYVNGDVFRGNLTLTSVEFLGEVSLAERAFADCANLTDVTGNISVCGEGAFDGTGVNFTVADDYKVIDGILIDYVGSGDVVIPAEVEYIPNYVFAGRKDVKSLSFASDADARDVYIEENAFRSAVNLATVELSDRIIGIGANAFYNTKWQNEYASDYVVYNGKLMAYIGEATAVEIPSDVTTFIEGVFTGNDYIVTVSFNKTSYVNIPARAFMNCKKLNTISFPTVRFDIGEDAFLGTAWHNNKINYVIVNGMLIDYVGTETDITIPSSVTKIYDYVFKGNTDITSLTFATGTNITTLNGEQFVGCTSLSLVTLPSSLNDVDIRKTFNGTAWLNNYANNFLIVDGVLLASFVNGPTVIPNSVTRIAKGAFNGAYVTTVSFDADTTVTVIPENLFAEHVELVSVTLPETIINVGVNAFSGTAWYDGLKDGAYMVGGTLLFYKGNATDIAISTDVRYIASSAFEGTSVKSVEFSSTSPVSIELGENALINMEAIYVPAEGVVAYKRAWLQYADKITAKA